MHAELGAWLFLYFLTAWSLVLCLEWNPHSATNVTTSSSDSIPPAPIRSHFPFSTVELVSVPSLYFVFPSLSSWAPSLFSPSEIMAELCLVYLPWFLLLLWLSTTFAYPRSGCWYTLVNGLLGFCVRAWRVGPGNLWAIALLVWTAFCGFQFSPHQGPASFSLNYARVISFHPISLKHTIAPGFRVTPRFLSLKNVNPVIFLSCFISSISFHCGDNRIKQQALHYALRVLA